MNEREELPLSWGMNSSWGQKMTHIDFSDRCFEDSIQDDVVLVEEGTSDGVISDSDGIYLGGVN